MIDNQQSPVSPAVVQHLQQSVEALRRELQRTDKSLQNATRLLNEQAEVMKHVYRENRELRKVLGVKADMQATVDQVQRLTAADFRVTIERVT